MTFATWTRDLSIHFFFVNKGFFNGYVGRCFEIFSLRHTSKYSTALLNDFFFSDYIWPQK